jgi:hypothetical protein
MCNATPKIRRKKILFQKLLDPHHEHGQNSAQHSTEHHQHQHDTSSGII